MTCNPWTASRKNREVSGVKPLCLVRINIRYFRASPMHIYLGNIGKKGFIMILELGSAGGFACRPAVSTIIRTCS